MNNLKLTVEEIRGLLLDISVYEGKQNMVLEIKSEESKNLDDKKYYFEEAEKHWLARRNIQFLEFELNKMLSLIAEYREKIRQKTK